ncbi:benzoate 4-monooxygenase cytochrome P450 [Xylaria cf. heliscus]|nr:benzoate 4-monooxygenase cytochrome P450 [Xylaria cf. heliscus]
MFIFFAYHAIFYPLFWGPHRHLAGPFLCKITSFRLMYHDLRCHRNPEILQWHRRHGPVICISPNKVSVSTLEDVRKVYKATTEWSKSNYFDHFTAYGGQRSIFAAKSHREHRDKRKLTSAFYQATAIYKLPELEQFVSGRCVAVLGHLEGKGGVVDVYALMNWFAMDVITYLVFGPYHSPNCVEGLCEEREILEDLKDLRFLGPFRLRFPRIFATLAFLLARAIPGLRYLRSDDALADWCQGRISAAMGDHLLSSSRSLLWQLLQTQQKNGDVLNKDYIAAELLDNIQAARATVAVTATCLIWLLSLHPQWQPLSFAEVNSRAPVLEACLREVYRLYPASSGRAERIVPDNGSTLSGVFVPGGTIVTSCVLGLHQDPELFPDGASFAPQTWLETPNQEADEKLLRFREAQLISFGYGGRICLGKALATMECSTQDAVPRSKTCSIAFRRLGECWQ